VNTPQVMIVDDEKNIRLTLAATLEGFGIASDTAATGNEALQKLSQTSFQVILLDLKLPDMDGLEVLRLMSHQYPNLKVIIMTAYGSIEAAVEAMKTGAVDFLQKPLEPNMVHNVLSRVLQGPTADPPVWNYEYYLVMAKRSISAGEFDTAWVYAKKAIFLDHQRPQAYNILGCIREAKGDRLGADKNYRLALEVDPTYLPAQKNLARVTRRPYTQMGIVWD
jgi:DNA-binding response OmpR family regulator